MAVYVNEELGDWQEELIYFSVLTLASAVVAVYLVIYGGVISDFFGPRPRPLRRELVNSPQYLLLDSFPVSMIYIGLSYVIQFLAADLFFFERP